MHIDKNHLYHGAALIQIAEDDEFTAINGLKIKGKKCKDAFRINDDIGIFLKYGTDPTHTHKEYLFNFDERTRDSVEEMAEAVPNFFLGLVCIRAAQICCLTFEDFSEIVAQRIKAKGEVEDQILLLVTAKKNQRFHVYVNVPGKKNSFLKKSERIIPRDAFPRRIFE